MPKTIFSGANQQVVAVLRKARIDAGLKQSEVAARIGRDQSWISLIEGSQRRVDVVEFIELARAIGTPPEKLFRQIVAQIDG